MSTEMLGKGFTIVAFLVLIGLLTHASLTRHDPPATVFGAKLGGCQDERCAYSGVDHEGDMCGILLCHNEDYEWRLAYVRCFEAVDLPVTEGPSEFEDTI